MPALQLCRHLRYAQVAITATYGANRDEKFYIMGSPSFQRPNESFHATILKPNQTPN